MISCFRVVSGQVRVTSNYTFTAYMYVPTEQTCFRKADELQCQSRWLKKKHSRAPAGLFSHVPPDSHISVQPRLQPATEVMGVITCFHLLVFGI